jgi:hypothetical protein
VLLDAGRVQVAASPASPAFTAAAERTYGVSLLPGDRLGFRRSVTPAGAHGDGS